MNFLSRKLLTKHFHAVAIKQNTSLKMLEYFHAYLVEPVVGNRVNFVYKTHFIFRSLPFQAHLPFSQLIKCSPYRFEHLVFYKTNFNLVGMNYQWNMLNYFNLTFLGNYLFKKIFRKIVSINFSICTVTFMCASYSAESKI